MQASFFDRPPDPTTHPAAQTSDMPSNVRRILAHKSGPLFTLADGQKRREFLIVEMTDGSFWRQYVDDGSRDKAPRSITPIFIEDGVRFGTWIEVEG